MFKIYILDFQEVFIILGVRKSFKMYFDYTSKYLKDKNFLNRILNTLEYEYGIQNSTLDHVSKDT